MTSQELSSEDLFDFSNSLIECADILRKCWLDNIIVLSSKDLSNLQINEGRLRDMGKNIRAAGIRSVLTDMANPLDKLKSLIQQTNQAISQFKELDKVLNLIAKVISIGGTILNVITSLTPPPVAISKVI